MELPSAFGYTVFCDDIRHEIGGKVSLIGTYKSDLLIRAELPVTLPKFGFAVTYYERMGVYPDHPLTLVIYAPGDPKDRPTVTVHVKTEGLRTELSPERMALVPTPMFHRLDSNLIAEPLIVKQEGAIKVRMLVGEERVKLGFIRVIASPPPENLSDPQPT